MDQQTKEKLEKYRGLDVCEHGKFRMRCPRCMWDVPAYLRREFEKYAKSLVKTEEHLTNILACGKER